VGRIALSSAAAPNRRALVPAIPTAV